MFWRDPLEVVWKFKIHLFHFPGASLLCRILHENAESGKQLSLTGGQAMVRNRRTWWQVYRRLPPGGSHTPRDLRLYWLIAGCGRWGACVWSPTVRHHCSHFSRAVSRFRVHNHRPYFRHYTKAEFPNFYFIISTASSSSWSSLTFSLIIIGLIPI